MATSLMKNTTACCQRYMVRSVYRFHNTRSFRTSCIHTHFTTRTIRYPPLSRTLSNHIQNELQYRRYLSHGHCALTIGTSPDNTSVESLRQRYYDVISTDETLSEDNIEVIMNIVDTVFLNVNTTVEGAPTHTDASAADALFFLGSRLYTYYARIGDEAFALAIPVFTRASELGHIRAKYTYSQLLLRGCMDIPSDAHAAASVLEELAADNHGNALFDLASLHCKGFGVEQSFEKGLELFHRAAEQGIPESHAAIGQMFLTGTGCDKDEGRAIEYFVRGAEVSDVGAWMALAHCYTHGKGVSVDHTQAFDYHTKAAGVGHTNAIYNLGSQYFSGKGVQCDVVNAAEYFRRAADVGHPLAQMNLGNMYVNGVGVNVDLNKAKQLYRSCTHKDAQILLQEVEELEKTMNEKITDTQDEQTDDKEGESWWTKWKKKWSS